VRAFVAVTLPPELVATLGACRAVLLDADPAWRREKWVADHVLHLTLRFLGDVGADALDRMADRLAATLEDARPFTLTFTGLSAVPAPRAASLIWAESPDPSGAAAGLAERVGEAACGITEPVPGRPFRAHVTLCRARRPRRVDPVALELAAAPLADLRATGRAMSVASVTLFTSTLTPSGPEYHGLVTVPLGG